MPITHRISGNKATIHVTGKLTFEFHRPFRDSYLALLSQGTIDTIDVNMEQVDYLDSSALGMLLLLKERAESAGIQVRLVKPIGRVRDILEVTSFLKIFSVVE